MPDAVKQVHVVCSRTEFDSVYSFLNQSGITCVHFETIKEVAESDAVKPAPVVVIDLDLNDDESFGLLRALRDRYPGICYILTWDTDKAVYPENIPGIFFCIKKPFTGDKLVGILEKAFSRKIGEERRREPRIPVELPVELFCRTKFWIARTTNLSLHGMQVAWDNVNIDEILETYTEGGEKITACRLFLGEEISFDAEHINISVNRRYTVNEDKGDLPTLMGFEFRDLDVDLRTKLQKVVIW